MVIAEEGWKLGCGKEDLGKQQGCLRGCPDWKFITITATKHLEGAQILS